MKKPVKEIVITENRAYLTDMEGNDALMASSEDTKIQVQRYASASLPLLFRKAVYIIENDESSRNVIEAMKFVKTLADGDTQAKSVESFAKRVSDKDLVEALSGDLEEIE
jgi:hypothetical protein